MKQLKLLLLTIFIGLAITQTAGAKSMSPAEKWAADSFNQFATPAEEVPPILYGVNFITEAEFPADSRRYADAHSTGAMWDRFPIYWQNVERTPNVYDWSAVDHAVESDLREGFAIDAILLGIPHFDYSGRAVPVGLNEPIFANGTDMPSSTMAINPNNRWAKWVHDIVTRYQPNGEWADGQGLPSGAGITHWEIWNEPDLAQFWDGSKEEFARLLKVGYMAAKAADPNTNIIFGGLATHNNINDPNVTYYADVLDILATDPQATQYGYYHDIAATHNYYYAWAGGYHAGQAIKAMADHGLDKPLWVNESGISAWNDYPGPVWDPLSSFRGTMQEQADYMIQAAFYSLSAGAKAYFHFKLHDGCGNQATGTDFPPHNGDLCRSDGTLQSDPSTPCGGDAFGMFRNYTDAACYTQHPQPGTARPQLTSFQFLTEYMQGVVPLNIPIKCASFDANGNLIQSDQAWVSFYRPNTNQRILAIWACRDDMSVEAVVPPIDREGARRFTSTGELSPVYAVHDGNYRIELPPATNNNQQIHTWRWPVGGAPIILIERDNERPSATLSAQMGNVANTIEVSWSGDDHGGGGLDSFDVEVSVDGGDFVVWLDDVRELSETYTGRYEYGVEFRVVAQDYGGNLSDPVTVLIGEEAPETLSTPTPKPTVVQRPTRIPLPLVSPTSEPTTIPDATIAPISTATTAPAHTPTAVSHPTVIPLPPLLAPTAIPNEEQEFGGGGEMVIRAFLPLLGTK